MNKKKYILTAFLVIVMIHILPELSMALTQTPDTEPYKKEVLQKKINHYQAEIKDINSDLFNLQDRMSWLNDKINRIQSAGRPLPQKLPETVSILKEKETSLKKKLQRIEPIYKKYQKQYNQLYAAENSMTVFSRQSKKIVSQLKKELEKAGIDQWIRLTQSDNGIVARVALPVVFGEGKTTVSDDYKSFFNKMGSIMKSYNVLVQINSFNPSDNADVSMDVGVSRALNVAKIMTAQGVSQSDFAIYNRLLDAKTPAAKSFPSRSVDIQFLIQGKKST